MVIALCTLMMIAEIVGGLIFGSIALVADGLHMSTHASALLLTALAYSYARRHAEDDRFSFGTGKLGDLAGFTSAIVLAMIAILIGYEAVTRLIWPVPIDFDEAIPIAVLGLIVNVASVFCSAAAIITVTIMAVPIPGHEHEHEQAHTLQTSAGPLTIEIFEEGVPPRFRLTLAGQDTSARGGRNRNRAPGRCPPVFHHGRAGRLSESMDEIPSRMPSPFASLSLAAAKSTRSTSRNTSTRRARATRQQHAVRNRPCFGGCRVSLLVIVGLLLGRFFSLAWMDPA